MALDYLLFVSFAAQAFGTFKEVLDYLWMFLEWLNYFKQFDEKTLILFKRMETLTSLEDDTNKILRDGELPLGKKRKREVDVWLENVERTRTEYESVRREISEKRYFYKPWLGRNLDACLNEVNDLIEMGKFSDGHFLDIPLASKNPFLTQELVGCSNGNVEKILGWLNDPGVSRIGVYGVEGVGKTAVLIHVQSCLSQSANNDFDHVYWVSAASVKKTSVIELQGSIAKQVDLNLSDEGESQIRAAKLHGFLAKRGKTVIIIDDLCEKLPIEEVGIQDCKLVLSASSSRACRRIGCHRSLEIEPLSDAEAMSLFKTLCCLDGLAPEFKDISELLVGECKGLPRRIIWLAKRLGENDDINEWRDVLNNVRGNNLWFSD